MDIACPNCAATYRVPDALLAEGKALRCAACGESWVPAIPAEPEARPADAAAPEPVLAEPLPASAPAPAASEVGPAEPQPSAPPPPLVRQGSPLTPPPLNRPPLQGRSGVAGEAAGGSGGWLRLAWIASIAIVLLALASLVLFGDAIAAAWPPFARVTALLGG